MESGEEKVSLEWGGSWMHHTVPWEREPGMNHQTAVCAKREEGWGVRGPKNCRFLPSLSTRSEMRRGKVTCILCPNSSVWML